MSRTDKGRTTVSRYMKYVFAAALLGYFYIRISVIMAVAPHFVYTSRIIDAVVSMGIIYITFLSFFAIVCSVLCFL